MPQIARQTTVGYAKETTKNTAVNTIAAGNFWSVKNFKVDPKTEYFVDDSNFGRRESVLAKEITRRHAEGEIVDYLDTDGAVGALLLHCFGAVSSVQTATTGAYTHTYSVLNNVATIPTFTLQYTESDIGNLRLRGGNVKKLTFDFGEKESTVKAEIIGIAEESGQSQTASYTKPNRPLLSKNLKARFANNVAGLNSGTEFGITKLTIDIENNADVHYDFGSVAPVDSFHKNFTAKVSFSGLIRNANHYNDFMSNTKRAYEFDCNADNLPVLGTSALFPRLRFRVPPSSIEITHTFELNDLMMFDATIEAEFSAVDNYLIEALLQNTTISY